MEEITGDTSDGYHTFDELYAYREVLNAALFNEWYAHGKYRVHKSWRHSDGELCFGGGWFIVVAELPTGQISNHYPAKDWHDFIIPRREIPMEWDGHTPQEALERLKALGSSVSYEAGMTAVQVSFWATTYLAPEGKFLYDIPLNGLSAEEVIKREGFKVISEWIAPTLNLPKMGLRQIATIAPVKFE